MKKNNHEEKGNWLQRLITKLIVLNPPYFGYKSDYESINNFKNKLIFIEKEKNKNSSDNYIPCLFFRNPSSSNYLIYFHGNSEHIFQIEHYGLDFRSYLDMNVIMVEYPGYSIYFNNKIDSKSIFSDSEIVFNWIKNKFKVDNDQIFVCGRSLGTSTAIYLSSKVNPKALFLISAFTSIKNIGKDYNASIFLEQIFNSYRYITDIKCPILFIHGKKDSLINYTHSVELYLEINKVNKCVDMQLNENMTHNDFTLKEDIINPINTFMEKFNLKSNKTVVNISDTELKDLYKMPLSISQIIELVLFDIEKFQPKKSIELKNAIFVLKSIDNDLIFSCGNKILIYNQRNYSLDEEIILNSKNKNVQIKSLFQMNNKDIICGTNTGEIFVYGKHIEHEENNQDMLLDIEEEYNEIKHLTEKGEIYKIDKFSPDKICMLTKNFLNFYDENFNEKNSCPLQSLYTNFVQISEDQIAMLSHDHLAIFKIGENNLEEIHRYNNIETNNFKNILTATHKYIIVGCKNKICLLDYTGDKKIFEFNVEGEINYINKIHDEFLLASTREGKILHINIGKDLVIKEKKFINGQINSLFLKNFKTILFTDDNEIQIWSSPKKEENCAIF